MDLPKYLDPPLIHKTSRERKSMKREKILERESRERKWREKSSYPFDEAIMVEIIRGPIRMTQYESSVTISNRIGLGSDLPYEFRSNLKSSYFYFKFILGSVM